MIVQVSPSLNIFEALSYNYRGNPALLQPGLRVVVPIGNRLTPGWIIETHSYYKGRVKEIIALVRDDYVPDSQFMAFVRAVSNLYFVSMGSLLDAALPPQRKPISSLCFENKENQGKVEKLNRHGLAQLQQLSKNGAIECFYKSKPVTDPAQRPGFGPEPGHESKLAVEHEFFISYQRENYYRQRIEDCLAWGKSVLITVPDNLAAAYFKERLHQDGIEIDIYNSQLKAKDRDGLWHDYTLKGKVGVVVGGLSAVFLPMPNLGLIICERAGSAIYKRSFFSRYNVQVVSQLRAQHLHIPLVEGFSAPTVQAYQNSSQVKSRDEREDRVSVDVHMIKSRTRGIPEDFQELVNSYFIENKKILVILNKKESVNFLFCGKCKKIQRCPSCEGFIDIEGEESFHMKCRRCGLEKESHNFCPKCEEPLALIEDISISSVKKFIKDRVVETGITTLSSEGLKEDHIHGVLKRVGESRIVIATPVVVNPFFSNIFDAVIYLRPESFFNLEEYDAAEKIFSLVSEFRGMVKAGGTIDIFSTFHFHYSLKLINEEGSFFERELKYREWFHLPPFFNVYNIEVRGKELRKLAADMRVIYRAFKESLKIKRVYLVNRQPSRGKYKYKGILEAHARPRAILKSGLLSNRDISIDLVLI